MEFTFYWEETDSKKINDKLNKLVMGAMQGNKMQWCENQCPAADAAGEVQRSSLRKQHWSWDLNVKEILLGPEIQGPGNRSVGRDPCMHVHRALLSPLRSPMNSNLSTLT